MLKWLRMIIAAVAIGLLLPAPAFAEDELPEHIEALLRAEDQRIKTMAGFAASREARADARAPIPERRAATAQTCGAAYTRRVDVSSAAELHQALASARPGDLIALADGIYQGSFVITASGAADAPITLCGSRAAILDAGALDKAAPVTYGLHLQADHWALLGFTVRNARKGIVADGASHNRLRGLEVHQIGDEGIHFRAASSDNLLEQSWVHDVGLVSAQYGEGVYIGSAHSNWGRHSGGQPDASDRNQVISNLIGPNAIAESVDVKEGTSDGVVRDNIFLGEGMRVADSWVDVKGNRYTVAGNRGLYHAGQDFKQGVEVNVELKGWGQHNLTTDNTEYRAEGGETPAPFRAVDEQGQANIVLPARAMPYTLAELLARFPESFERMADDSVLLKEHLVVGPEAQLVLDQRDVRELRLLSTPERFASIVGHRGAIQWIGGEQPIRVSSWDPAQNAPDQDYNDGRAYITMYGGRMDIDRGDFSNLGFGTGRTSGVSWKGLPSEKSVGNVTSSRFAQNYFGVYTYEAEGMRWIGNQFTNNAVYGFDPHDFSNNFLVENNVASYNGKHGLIFSRGCSGNVLRGNKSFNNGSFGIMIDDGKVAPGDGDPRHAVAVPSGNNTIEGNEVWGNQIGIVIEGGAGNTVRANDVYDNPYGISIKNGVTESAVTDNQVRASAKFGIYVYNNSSQNHIAKNSIQGGQGGMMIEDASANRIEHNSMQGITGRGMVLAGDLRGSTITNNTLVGQGSQAIDTSQAQGLSANLDALNATGAWEFTGEPTIGETMLSFVYYHPGFALWAIILTIPILGSLLFRRRIARGM